ncbi:MAG: efflux RND transporter periplasmic adaptor subunit [Actinomycetota bacterium]|nr:efflux RND transporter periplasmic adaptor subunit [Actinomycetota bacterium]
MPASLDREPRTVNFSTIKLSGLLLAGLACLSCGKKQAPPPPPPVVEVATVIQKDVPITKEWIGSLDGFVNADIRPQVTGYVLSQVYKEGSFVRRGDVLFEIDPRQFQAALDQAKGFLAQNEAALGKAKLDVARFKPLVAERAISQQELDNAVSAERQAQANVDSARAAVEQAQLNLGWTKVKSPIDGIAGIAKSQVGDLVNGQTTMTTVSVVDPIKVYFNPSEQEYMAWAQKRGPVDAVRSTPPQDKGMLSLVLSDGTAYPQRGDPVLANRNVDVKTGTIQVEGVFPNPNHLLRPGQYAKVHAAMDVKKGAILVPQRAVSELQGLFQVAVVGPSDKVEIRPVQTGDRIGSLWIIEKGLSPGDRVVVEGIQKVKPDMVVNPKPAEENATPGTPTPSKN